MDMGKSLVKFLGIIIISVLLHNCTEDSVSPSEEFPVKSKTYESLDFSDKIKLETYPNIGDVETEFKFNIELNDPNLSIKKIKYDFSYDYEYDSTLTVSDTLKTMFKLFGYNTIIATAVLEDATEISCSTIIWVTGAKTVSSDGGVYYEPNIYNGNYISVTHGGGHPAQFIDYNTFEMTDRFDGYSENLFVEMHITVPSFDGTKLIFDNGRKYKFCYYDLVKDDSTITDIPLYLKTYPVGQITWSLDDKLIFAVSMDENYQYSGIKSYNLETQGVKNIYNSGDYICVIPDENDKLAILEKVDDNFSKILVYNIVNNVIEQEYSEIPFHAPFRMLKDADRVYFDGKMAFYSLSRKKTFYMDFNQIDLDDHTYGEADINMDGNKFIIGTWHDNPTLYMYSLPNNF